MRDFSRVTPTAVRITSLPTNAVPGERIVSFAGVSVPFETVITDPEVIAAAHASDAYTLWTIDPSLSDLTLTVDYALAEPLRVVVVPPAAVGGSVGSFCVEGRSGTVPVEVVGSQLGQSFVTSDRDLPSEVRLPPPGGQIACG